MLAGDYPPRPQGRLRQTTAGAWARGRARGSPCGGLDRIDWWLWTALAVIGLECLALLMFKMACPLTLVARRYSNSQLPNFDIYLPLWLAKYNKLIYGIILVGILAGLAWRLL